MLYYENYGVYETLARNGYQEINTNTINKENISNHILWIVNILRDGIETEEVMSMKIRVTFADNYSVYLYITDYFFNLIWWNLIVSADSLIYAKYIYFPENQTNKYNKNYIDLWFIEEFYGMIDKLLMNNIIDNTLSLYRYINEFALYLCNTVSLRDDIELMRKNPEVYDIIHTDLSNVPLDKYKEEGVKRTNRLVEIIRNDPNHWAGAMFRAAEGINPKQFKENNVNIGLKPNGEGSVHPIPINSNLLYLGALKDLAYAIIDYSGGRQAQIINASNVGKSGSFARTIKLNCMDLHLHRNPKYVCNTRNFVKIEIKNEKILQMLDGMTFRNNPKGLDMVLRASKHKHLIGTTMYFRTAYTCASHARGDGICHACYGQLAFINSDINIGVMAAEEFSASLTQKMLSAKHLLEEFVKSMGFSEEFLKFFMVEFNEIKINPANEDINNYEIHIDMDNDIEINEEYDNVEFNEFIYSLKLVNTLDDSEIIFECPTNLFLIKDFLKLLSHSKNDDNISVVKLVDLINMSLFVVEIDNTELSESLTKLQKVIDNSSITTKFTKDEIMQEYIETALESGLYINATHCAVILADQVRAAHDSSEYPDWEYEDAEYQILPLKRSLKRNPSITKRLNYNYIKAALVDPSSFKISKASVMDLFYMVKPQEYIDKNYVTEEEDNRLRPMINLL